MVTVADQKLNKVILRGNTLKSPYGSYDGYLREALRQELQDAGFELQNKSQADHGLTCEQFMCYRLMAGLTMAGVLLAAGCNLMRGLRGSNGVSGTGRLNPATRGSSGCAP